MRVHRSQHPQEPKKPSKILMREVERLRHLEIPQWALYTNAKGLRKRVSSSAKWTTHSRFLGHKFK
jgi:hypothetical protein